MQVRDLKHRQTDRLRKSIQAFLHESQPNLNTIIDVIRSHSNLAEAAGILKELRGYGNPEQYRQLEQWLNSQK